MAYINSLSLPYSKFWRLNETFLAIPIHYEVIFIAKLGGIVDICDFSLNANFGDFEEDAYFRTKEKDVKGHVMHVENFKQHQEKCSGTMFKNCQK